MKFDFQINRIRGMCQLSSDDQSVGMLISANRTVTICLLCHITKTNLKQKPLSKESAIFVYRYVSIQFQ